MITWDDFTKLVGNLLIYGTPTVVVLGALSKKAAEKWVETYFTKRQKEFEHEQAKELQRLKVKIDTVIQGALKLQEREFRVIPESWEKVSEAYGLAMWLCSPMQEYSSLHYLSREELNEFVERSTLLETQKAKLRAADSSERDKLWQEMDTWQRRNKVRSALSEADRFVKVNGVFLPDSLRDQFNRFVETIWHALISYDNGSQSSPKDWKMIRESWQKLKDEGEPLHKAIEEAVRRRLVEQSEIAEEKLTEPA
ncbi:MAG TPA: hypothetical protein DCP03_22740 [Polaromonas sp.]|uniref:hypothetical protein n=1 Tax=Polaromonas sp. UBA4122 TaxID=1947074 RepID=UPI000EE293B3|nr:hypothetical protein [Polaromonas sp. UBA4122]HAL40756.1 hypothetical protein [Polaromonas sp.]